MKGSGSKPILYGKIISREVLESPMKGQTVNTDSAHPISLGSIPISLEMSDEKSLITCEIQKWERVQIRLMNTCDLLYLSTNIY